MQVFLHLGHSEEASLGFAIKANPHSSHTHSLPSDKDHSLMFVRNASRDHKIIKYIIHARIYMKKAY